MYIHIYIYNLNIDTHALWIYTYTYIIKYLRKVIEIGFPIAESAYKDIYIYINM
jgi:hypothetical protein